MSTKPAARLYRIVLPYACFGVDVDDNGQVVDAAPIGRWMIGKSLELITRWVRGKHGTIEDLSQPATPC